MQKTWRALAICVLGGWMAGLAPLPGFAAELPVLRIAVLKFGTVNWLMETLKKNGLDQAQGFDLKVLPLAGKAATTIALQAGDTDVIVTDWVWAMHQRNATGANYRFFPYSRALGVLMVHPKSEIVTICDLRDRRIGVVGGPLDKNWLLYQALVRYACQFDLVERTQVVFGAPPLMSQQIETGGVDAVATYWHYGARLEAKGYVPLLGVDAAMTELGIPSPPPPLIGFVWNVDQLSDRPQLIEHFQAAVNAANDILRDDDAAWDAIRPMMRAPDNAAFEHLRNHYREAIAKGWAKTDTDAARNLYSVLSQVGGSAFLEGNGTFIEDVFWVDDE